MRDCCYGSDQADRQRQLDVPIPALIAIDEVLQKERNVALLQIAAPPQLLGDIGGNVLRAFLGSIEPDQVNWIFILTGQRVDNDASSSAARSSASRQTRPIRPRSSVTR